MIYYEKSWNYIIIYLWIKILGYIGISTSQIIAGCYTIFVIFLFILLIQGKFKFGYIIAIFVCEFGSGIIIMNEKNPNTSKII